MARTPLCSWIDGNKPTVGDVVRLQARHLPADLLLGDRLQIPIEGRDHVQAALLEQFIAVGLLQLRRDPVHEMGCLAIGLR